MHSMETKRQTESVLAKLMGIDEPMPNKQSYRGRQRVLSESYLQDIALICQRQKWSFDRYSMDIDEMVEQEDSSEEMASSSSSEEFLERYGKEAEKGFWLLNSVQKADKDYTLFGANYSPNLLNSPKEMESFSHLPLKRVPRNENLGMSDTSSALRKKGLYSGRKEKDRLRYRREALGHGFTVSNGVAKQVANQLERSVWHDSLNAFGCGNTTDSGFGMRDRSPEDMNTSKSNVCRTQTQSISSSTSVPSTGIPKFRNRTFSVHRDWCLDLVNGGRSYCNSLRELNCQSEDLRRRNSTSIDSVGKEDNVSREETPSNSCDLNEFGKNDRLEKISKCSDVESVADQAGERVLDELFDMLQEIGSCGNEECKKFDASAEQVVDDTLKPLHEPDNGSPPCPSPTEAYKVNPDSFSKSEDTSSDKVVSGSEVELQQPVAKFFELEAERNIRSKKMRFDTKDIILGTDKTKEIHIFSYLVDVLAELGLHFGEKKLSLSLRQPLESFTDPSVFENLEKKYGEQPFLPKSERKLLFDRIKGGLSDILSPYMDLSAWSKCRMKRRVIRYNEEMIKEDLLAALASQEKEVRKESSRKMDGIEMDWLELEEDKQTIAMEIEAILIDELVEEIISTELFI